MLFPNLKIYLASQSPRRKSLLEQACFTFEVLTKDVEEIIPDGLESVAVPEYLAKLKADAVKEQLSQENELIISSDTIVCLGDTIYGKPKDAQAAKATLWQLSGKKHQVITGVCLTGIDKQYTFSDSADVYFNSLTAEQIDFYVDNYQPYDKAGSYAIQQWIGLVGIDKIDGCYFNIMGLPISKLIKEIEDFIR